MCKTWSSLGFQSLEHIIKNAVVKTKPVSVTQRRQTQCKIDKRRINENICFSCFDFKR